MINEEHRLKLQTMFTAEEAPIISQSSIGKSRAETIEFLKILEFDGEFKNWLQELVNSAVSKLELLSDEEFETIDLETMGDLSVPQEFE